MPKTKSTEKRYPITINIIKSLRFEASPVGKTANWILTIGKTGVFITFSIIVIALIYRFSLDRKVETTRDLIKDNIATIESYNKFDTIIRSVHKKIQFILKLNNFNKNSVIFFQKIESNLPKDVKLDTLNIDYNNGSIQLRGKTSNEVVFSQMLNALRRQDEFSEISIDQIQSGGALNP